MNLETATRYVCLWSGGRCMALPHIGRRFILNRLTHDVGARPQEGLAAGQGECWGRLDGWRSCEQSSPCGHVLDSGGRCIWSPLAHKHGQPASTPQRVPIQSHRGSPEALASIPAARRRRSEPPILDGRPAGRRSFAPYGAPFFYREACGSLRSIELRASPAARGQLPRDYPARGRCAPSHRTGNSLPHRTTC